jgi:hypothetical protein
MMKSSFPMGGSSWKPLLVLLLCTIAAGVAVPTRTVIAGADAPELQPIPASEFSRLIREFSEEDGYFRSDNFTSNETSYLQVTDQFRQLGISGGAYIGVGPEQNFTYIAKVRPRIAFIVDIRRQAMLQHLFYKAAFQQAETRAQFLAALLCRPLPGTNEPLNRASISDLLEYFRRSPPATDQVFTRNLARVRRIIQEDFRFPLTDSDPARLEYVYSAFRNTGLDISFRFGGRSWQGYGQFPTLADLILQKDQQGRLGNFLASDDDYQFVRHLQLLNRIIPVVGDFAGSKALVSVGRYLAKNKYTVSAFYTSNVEQFLFQNGMYGEFLANVRELPIDGRSVFVRAVARMGQVHPAHLPGHRSTTVLQKISIFLRDQDAVPYPSYWDVVTKHYIPNEQHRSPGNR